MSGNTKISDFEAVRCMSVDLSEKLDSYLARLEIANASIAALYDNLIVRLVDAEAGHGALAAGSELPPFLLPDSEGALINSRELLDHGPLVISFNRGQWCSFCRFELLSLGEIFPEITVLNAKVVSITPERAAVMEQRRKDDDLPFPILVDIDNGYALESGLMVSLGNAVKEALSKVGKDLAEFQGNSGLFVPIPATCVVGQDGIIKASYVNPDFRNRMPPRDILDALEALQD